MSNLYRPPFQPVSLCQFACRTSIHADWRAKSLRAQPTSLMQVAEQRKKPAEQAFMRVGEDFDTVSQVKYPPLDR